MLLIDAAAVRALLPMAEAVACMRAGLARHGAGGVTQRLRAVLAPPGGPGLLAVMPAWAGADQGGFGVKAGAIYPGNPALRLDPPQGAGTMFYPPTRVPPP